MPGQQAAPREEIRQAGIAMGEARHRRYGRQRLQFGQNVGCSSTEVDIIEIALVDQTRISRDVRLDADASSNPGGRNSLPSASSESHVAPVR